MGDISEYRGLVVAVSFLGIFALFINLVPAEFFTASQSNKLVGIPEDLVQAYDIYSFAETQYTYLNSSHPVWWINTDYRYWSIDIGGWDIDFYFKNPNVSAPSYCWLVHIWTEWYIWPSDHYLTLYDMNAISLGETLSIDEFEGEAPFSFRAKCDHTTYYMSLSYNTTLYSSFEDAWNHEGVAAFAGVNFDDVNTSYNAFDLIAGLLFFAWPAETPIIIRAFLSIPIWACVSYLIFIFILRAIGAVFGGGA